MGTQTPQTPQTPKPDDQAQQTAPGKPSSRQPTHGIAGDNPNQDREEGQDIPKTGLDPFNEDEDEDEDEAGTIEFPGESREGDQAHRSAPAGNA